jgi:hypothetical protein
MTTTTTGTVPQRNLSKAGRFVATFVAGAALASGIFVGVGAADDSTPAASRPAATAQTNTAPGDPGCLQLRGPC